MLARPLVLSFSIALLTCDFGHAKCDINGCLQGLKDIPQGIGDCAQVLAEDGANPAKDIKCPFTALGVFEKLPACHSCTQIGPCDTSTTAPDSAIAQSCGNGLNLVDIVGPNKCAQLNNTATPLPMDRLASMKDLYRFHCNNSQVVLARGSRCTLPCSACSDQCGDPPLPSLDTTISVNVTDLFRKDAAGNTTTTIQVPSSQEGNHQRRTPARQSMTEALRSTDYRSKCITRGNVYMTENLATADPHAQTADPRAELAGWRLALTDLAAMPNERQTSGWECDHILELWQLQRFFGLPDGTGTWARGNPRWQDIWMNIANGRDNGGGAFTGVKNILNDARNLYGVDERINDLKKHALLGNNIGETWSDATLQCTSNYLYEMHPVYMMFASLIGTEFNRIGGYTGYESDAPRVPFEIFCEQRFQTAMVNLNTKIQGRGPNHVDAARYDIVTLSRPAPIESDPDYSPSQVTENSEEYTSLRDAQLPANIASEVAGASDASPGDDSSVNGSLPPELS